ncbi:MAG: heavy metal translocating P-type ATPase [Granulosicoccus sp.]|nr:heavy metal translocating P-type ATPase [Granulosicoccus sp.]
MRCYHCTENVLQSGRWQVEFDGQRHDVCCAGCEAVMRAIVDAGLGDYYRFRTEPAEFGVLPDDLAARLDELAVFDEPEFSERYLQPVEPGEASQSSDLVDLNLSVAGLRCGACVWVLERSVGSLPGVARASVNFSSARASIRFDATRLRLSDILRRVSEMGFQAAPFDARERELALRRESRIFLQRLFVAGIATMQVMMYALPAYLSDAGEIDPAHENLLRWASLVLTTPVLLYSAVPFLQGAWRDVLHRQPGMDVPVSIGILAAFLASVRATITGVGEIYFDSVAMFVFLLLGARYLEWSARRRAMRTVDDISAAAPETAQRILGDVVETVPAARLDLDDLIIVNNGERIPVDAVVSSGRSAVNNALVTGESAPIAVGPGDELAGGALLCGAPVQLRVLRRQAASTLSVIDRLIDRGASEKPATVRMTDRIATLFVTALLLLAALVWMLWLYVDPSRAASTAIAVLVVSCPCALSMATPAAMAATTGALLRSRMLITRGHALETLSRVTDVVFDKTGTLTTGSPRVSAIQLGPGQEQQAVLQLATALETGSTHPCANALRLALADLTLDASVRRDEQAPPADAIAELKRLAEPAIRLEHAAGQGVAAMLKPEQGRASALFLGSASWCALSAPAIRCWQVDDEQAARASSEVYLVRRPLPADVMMLSACHEPGAPPGNVDTLSMAELAGEPQVLARFLIRDTLRPEVSSLIRALHDRQLMVHLLSGDRREVVEAVAASLQISRFAAAATPADKQGYVADLQAGGATVLMVGDGINDAPVLASADVSLAAGEATALARTAADVISLMPGLEGLDALLVKSAQTMQIVRQNLAWAILYNATAIPLAALGFVPPWAAAVGMAGSSLLVVANAQRLWSAGGSLPALTRPLAGNRLWNRFSF